MSKGIKNYKLGLTKEPSEPIDLQAIYEKVKKKREKDKS